MIPLLLLAWARRGLSETRRFSEQVAPEIRAQGRAFTAILRGPYAGRVLLLGVIWMLIYACTQNAITFWKEFAVAERGFSDVEVGRSIAIAAIAAMPLVFGVGTLLDAVGRRRGAVLIFGVTALGVFGATDVLPVRATALLPLIAAGLMISASRSGRSDRKCTAPQRRNADAALVCSQSVFLDPAKHIAESRPPFRRKIAEVQSAVGELPIVRPLLGLEFLT